MTNNDEYNFSKNNKSFGGDVALDDSEMYEKLEVI